jgi:NAD(P)H-dependent FMN reductase
MKITIINGTNRTENETIKISDKVNEIVTRLGYKSSLISLNNFTEMFLGEYLTIENAHSGQKLDLENIADADIIIFIVPTYHHSIPGSLANFLDLIDDESLFKNKVIGVISSNAKGRNEGAHHTKQKIEGILAHQKSITYVLPLIPVLDFGNIDEERVENFLKYCLSFVKVEVR